VLEVNASKIAPLAIVEKSPIEISAFLYLQKRRFCPGFRKHELTMSR